MPESQNNPRQTNSADRQWNPRHGRNHGRVPFDQNFRKFQFKIEWYRKLEISGSIWHIFPVWISPSSFSCEKLKRLMAAGESFDTTLDAKWSATVRACTWSPILLKNVRIWFPEKLWTGRFEFPVSQFAGLHTLPRAEKVRIKFLLSHISWSEFWMRVKLLYVKQITALKTATSSPSYSSLSSNSW